MAKIYYEIYYAKFLVMIKIFKNWRHYLENYKNEILVLINNNILHQSINITGLNFCHIFWSWNYSIIIFVFIIVNLRLRKLLIILFIIFSRAKIKTKFFKLGVQKFFNIHTICSLISLHLALFFLCSFSK